MITAYSCIRFMPVRIKIQFQNRLLRDHEAFLQVADAMTLVFTNPLFTLIFELLFFGTKLSVIKGLGGSLATLIGR